MTDEVANSTVVDTAVAASVAPTEVVVADAVPITESAPSVASILTPPADLIAEPVVAPTDVVEPVVAPIVPEVPAEIVIPTYEPFVFPEGATVDEATVSDFTKTIADFEIATKADHAETQKFAQSLIDRHIAQINKFREAQVQEREAEKASWAADFKNDQEFGGVREQATIEGAQKFIRTHGGTAEQQRELYDILARTGLDNHKAIIRIFAKASVAPSLSEGTLRATPQVASQLGILERFYGKE